MMKFLKKPFAYAALFGVALTSWNGYVLAKTFLIPSVQGYVTESADDTSSLLLPEAAQTEQGESSSKRRKGGDSSGSGQSSEASSDASQDNGSTSAITTDSSYSDGNISINIRTVRVDDTTAYVADVKLASASYLRTALAQNAFGRNVTQKTSEIAAAHNAILAVNGDYYGANNRGYVIKNGVLYRDTVRKDTSYDDLVIYKDGSFGLINESSVTAQQLIDDGVYQLLAFGPALVKNGQIAVSAGEEVGRAMANNPRTAIGVIDDLHYLIVVADGRTSASTGLSLYQLAQLMQQYGCRTAYNLDGGGSSTMVFNGTVVNQPTTGGRIAERAVSDIVYIGY